MFLKILAFAVTGSLLIIILKKYCRELVPFFEFVILAGALFLIFGEDAIKNNSFVRLVERYSESAELFGALFKGAAVTVLTKLASDICNESANVLMGNIVELAGRITLIILSLPFIEGVAEIALSFTK